MKNKLLNSLSISQNILISTIGIVFAVLLTASLFYYLVFSNRVNALIEEQSREINKQIVFNYERYIESIIETANFIQTTSSPYDLSHDFSKLQNIYNMNSRVKRDVVAIFLFDSNGRKLLGDKLNPSYSGSIKNTRWFKLANYDPAIYSFVSQGAKSIALNKDEEVIAVSKQISYMDNGSEKKGVLLIELNFQIIRNLAEKMNLGESGMLLILDKDDSVVYSSTNQPVFLDKGLQIASSIILGSEKIWIAGHQMLININTLSYTRWRIATFTNVDEINGIRQGILPVFLIIFLVSIGISGIASGFISMRISRPIHQLQEIMERIEMGEINTAVSVTGQKEIVMLGNSFNRMIDKIRELMDRIVKEQREKRKTELRALQNQINPHFLYNSLDSIVWLAEHGRSEDVITTVIALARFFRISISGGAIFIPVKDEVEHVKNYLTIQSIRYMRKIEFKFDIQDNIKEKIIMKLILQPIVENAIHHGLEDEGGWIKIIGREAGSSIIFEIINSGYGVSEKRLKEMNGFFQGKTDTGVGVGLRNVTQRLKLYYGDSAGIFIHCNENDETIVTVTIPFFTEKLKEV